MSKLKLKAKILACALCVMVATDAVRHQAAEIRCPHQPYQRQAVHLRVKQGLRRHNKQWNCRIVTNLSSQTVL